MKTSKEIRESIGSVDSDLRLIHTRVAAAHLAVEQLRKTAIISLAFAKGGEDDNPGNQVGAIIAFAQSNAGRDLAAASVVLEVLESDPAFIEAKAILDPLHAALAEAVERELAAAHKHRVAEVAVEEAQEAARQELLAKIDSAPGVVKAKADLSKLRRLGQPLDVLAGDFHD